MNMNPNKTNQGVTRNMNSTMARSLAPEDIRAGCYITVLKKVTEHFPWAQVLDESTWRQGIIVPQRLEWLPRRDTAGRPLEVIDVCLPFVLVRDRLASKNERIVSMDVRRYRFAQLPEPFARTAIAGQLAMKRRKRKRKTKRRQKAASKS